MTWTALIDIVACGLLPTFFAWVYFHTLTASTYEMDPAGHKFMFPIVWQPYRVAYWLICILSFVGAFGMAMLHQVLIGAVFFEAAFCAMGFNLWVMLCYESYLAERYSMVNLPVSNYTRRKYAVTLALGTSAVILFVIAMGLAFVTIAGH